MSAVDHAAETLLHITRAHEQQEHEGDFGTVVRDNALLAQAHATMAQADAIRELAAQQRIANMIALAASQMPISDGSTITNTEPFAIALRDRIATGLGMDDWTGGADT